MRIAVDGAGKVDDRKFVKLGTERGWETDVVEVVVRNLWERFIRELRLHVQFPCTDLGFDLFSNFPNLCHLLA